MRTRARLARLKLRIDMETLIKAYENAIINHNQVRSLVRIFEGFAEDLVSELPDLSSCCSSVVKSFWLESSTGPITDLGLTALGLEFRV